MISFFMQPLKICPHTSPSNLIISTDITKMSLSIITKMLEVNENKSSKISSVWILFVFGQITTAST